MTLDEAIKHCEDVAERHDRIKQIKAVTLEECKCAEEHRQLAAWLRELKAYRVKSQESDDESCDEIWEKAYKEREGKKMTKEDAIKILNTVLCLGKCDCTKDEIEECLKMSIKALEAQPSEDWNAVLDELNRIGRNAFKDDTDYDNLFDFISNLPNVKPQSKTEGARGDIPLQQSVPKMPQPEKHTEERTETHEYDYISRKDIGLTNLEILMCNGDYKEALKMLLDKIEKASSVTPQPKEEPQQKTGHWILSGGYWRCSECKEKALLKLDKATGGYREYEPVRSKYCPGCGAKMQEVK